MSPKPPTPSAWAAKVLPALHKATASAAASLTLQACTMVNALLLRVTRNINPHAAAGSRNPVTAREANQACIQAASIIRRHVRAGHPALDILARIPRPPQ